MPFPPEVPPARAIQLEILRRMTGDQKLHVLAAMRQWAWDLTAAGIRSRHPGLAEEEVEARVREAFRRAGT